MPLIPRLRSLYRNLVRRRAVDEDLADELGAYVDELAERKRRAGLDPGAARRQALAEMGGVSHVQHEVRRQRVGSALESWLLDIGYAVRRMRASPGFTAAAVLTVALGVGLNAGAFSILNAVLFSALPVPAAGELVDLYEVVDGLDGRNEKGWLNRRVTTSEYRTFRDDAKTLTGLIGYSTEWTVWLRGERSRQIVGRYVSCNYFEVLRQPAAIGRGLLPDDCRSGAPPVVVLGHGLWRTTFAGDPAVVGRTVTLNRAQVTVVGVAPPDVYQPELQRLDYFAPIGIQPALRPDRDWLVSETFGWLTLIGRRGPGHSVEAVQAELNVIAARIDRQSPGRSTRVFVDPATASTNQLVSGGLLATGALAVFGPFGLVLLIACANVANLFLARTAERAHEIATRFSLGASRGRVVQQLLTESLLVSLLGGALGLVLAVWSFEGLAALLLSPLAVALPEPSLEVRLLGFALVLSLGTGVLTGLAPALRASGSRLHATTNRLSSTSGQHGGGRLQGAFIGVQVAICMILLIGAGAMLRVLYDANLDDPGFPSDEVVVLSADLRDFGYVDDELALFQQRLTDEVRALPGVESVVLTPTTPWDRRSPYGSIAASDADGAVHQFATSPVEPDYLSTLGIRIVRGRSFADADFTEPPSGVIVSEATADSIWPGQDPIGRTLTVRLRPRVDATSLGPDELARWARDNPPEERIWRVVGVAADALTAFGPRPAHLLYLPTRLAPRYRHMLSVLVRSRRPFASLAPDIGGVLDRLDPDVTMGVAPLEANRAEDRYLSALASGLAVSLGLLALALASVGIYAVVAHVVASRRREIGIRLALGARSRSVLATLLRRTLRPVVVGAAIGGLGALAVSGLLASAVFGVERADPIAIGGAALLVLGVALVASIVPARRGLRADPLRTLQSE